MKNFITTLRTAIKRRYDHATSNGRPAALAVLAFATLQLFAPEVLAQVGGALPWETGLRTMVRSLCGPLAQGMAIVAIVACGIAIAFGEVKGWIHNMLIVIIGVSIAVMAPNILTMVGIATTYTCS